MMPLSDNPVINAILERRSVRRYTGEPLPSGTIEILLEAARWAPSGLNNQPWRFLVMTEKAVLRRISPLTNYKKIIDESSACIAVFFHKPSGYNRDKDLMSIGACVQNILLAAYALGLGAVWLGEILNRKNEFSELLGIVSDNELCAVVALGVPDEIPARERKPLKELML